MVVLLSTVLTNLGVRLLNKTCCAAQLVSSSNLCLLPELSLLSTETRNRRYSVVCLLGKQEAVNQTKEQNHSSKTRSRKRVRKLVLSEGKEEDENYGLICPGCGVFMQDEDPNLPGYYRKRTITIKRDVLEQEDYEDQIDDFDGLDEHGDADEEFKIDIEGATRKERRLTEGGDFIWDYDEFDVLIKVDKDDLDLNGFAPAGVGYGNITEEIVEKERRRKEERKLTKAKKKRIAREAKRESDEVTVCARCHSLRNYGDVKSQTAENLIPDFDFNRLITSRLMKTTGSGNATVVVMVVDCVDFDGSFPRRATKCLFEALELAKNDPRASKKLPKLVLVATKVDLLPSQISPTRLDRWVRHRARAGGAPKLSGVYLASARKDLGVKSLLSFIKELAGPRGNVWVIGAQNAGKSTLINAFSKKEGAKIAKLTEASVPGTTLGILRIQGILSAKAKMYDTPGLLHPYLMSMRLNREEQKMIEIRKELQPRTYRMKVGQTVHVGGLLRLDLNEASVETIYVTVWASPSVSLHLGKRENADELWRNHFGIRLQPPIGNDRASELGTREEKEIKVAGTSWDVNSIDIAVGGLGWLSLGLKGEATLTLWAYDGIEITLREPLVLDRAPFLERPGFWLPKAISDAIGNQTKIEAKKRKKFQQNCTIHPLEVSA
ncbi:hypothetical protein K2173_015429 [Erythroxylum novogranatense]|uniref:CP-type G domain-containing protein n=1 Tax=Erythroxylum novogranatense TaxID=1862640 RepID=A0AAV8SRM0_9ROSI|nr:hypothetical protein K2173_015429 [Erythroxylum novogranatense]